MISTDDRAARVLVRRSDTCVAIEPVTVIAASDARRVSAGISAALRCSSILDSLARWSSELLHHDTHQKENHDELD
jgi:hypothetical protein